jgi:phenylacetate-CoA ligase
LSHQIERETGSIDTASRRYLDPEVELADRETIREWQWDFLQSTIDRAYERSSFFRTMWEDARLSPGDIRSLEEYTNRAPSFEQKQVTSWARETGDPFGGLLCMDRRDVSFIGATSGTTGVPMALPQYEGNPRAVSASRDLCETQLQQGDTVVRLNVVSRTSVTPSYQGLIDDLGLKVISLGHHPASAPGIIEASRRFHPVSLNKLSRPVISAIRRYGERKGIDLAEIFGSYSSVIFGGDVLDASTRSLLQSWFGTVRIHTSLGNTIAAEECSEGNGAHTWEDLVLVEILDPGTGLPTRDGDIGELIVTTLQEKATPLLRFRTEDLVRFTSERCQCGRTHGRMWTMGRKGDLIDIDGRSLLPAQILTVLTSIPETRDGVFQLLRGDKSHSSDSLGLRIGRIEGRPDSELAGVVVGQIQHELGISTGVELRPVEEMITDGPGYKLSRGVSR